MLGNYHTHSVLALIQSLFGIIEFALYNVYFPVGGMVELASLWYRLFQQQSHRVRKHTAFILRMVYVRTRIFYFFYKHAGYHHCLCMECVQLVCFYTRTATVVVCDLNFDCVPNSGC